MNKGDLHAVIDTHGLDVPKGQTNGNLREQIIAALIDRCRR